MPKSLATWASKDVRCPAPLRAPGPTPAANLVRTVSSGCITNPEIVATPRIGKSKGPDNPNEKDVFMPSKRLLCNVPSMNPSKKLVPILKTHTGASKNPSTEYLL